MSGITVEKLYTTRTQDLELTLLNSSTAGLNKVIHHPELHRPGLALTGFFERFANRRVQIVGETEMAYMNRLPLERLAEISHLLFEKDIPMVIISKGLTPPPEFLDAADRHRTGVFSSRLTTAELAARLSAYLDHIFAPSITVHGTLVDVYGVGLLYTGKSGIGKSEVALDLIERGHRLVADDVVKITRAAPDVVKGSGSELLGHHMEIRGVGIIDIEGLFGIRAIRMQKRIEVEVNLTLWSETDDYERLGLEGRYTHDPRRPNPHCPGPHFPRQEHHRHLRSHSHEPHAQGVRRKLGARVQQEALPAAVPAVSDQRLPGIGLRIAPRPIPNPLKFPLGGRGPARYNIVLSPLGEKPPCRRAVQREYEA